MPPPLQIENLRTLARVQFYLNPEESVHLLRQALTILENIDPVQETNFSIQDRELSAAYVQVDLGVAYRIIGDTDSAIGYLHMGMKAFEKYAQYEFELTTLTELSLAQLLHGSLQASHTSLTILEELINQSPNYKAIIPETLPALLQATIYWQLLSFSKATFSVNKAETCLSSANSLLLEGLYFLFKGLYLIDIDNMPDNNTPTMNSSPTEYFYSSMARWQLLEFYPPIIDSYWAVITYFFLNFKFLNIKVASDVLSDLESLWTKLKGKAEKSEIKRLLVIIQYSRIIIEIAQKTSVDFDKAHFLRAFKHLLKIARGNQILDIKLVCYAQVFFYIFETNAYKEKQEKTAIIALLEDFNRDVLATRSKILHMFFTIFKASVLLAIDLSNVKHSMDALHSIKEFLQEENFSQYLIYVEETEKKWLEWVQEIKKSSSDLANPDTLVLKFQASIITDIYHLLALFNSRIVFQYVFSFRILTMIDWKQKIYSDTVVTPFYVPKQLEDDNFSETEIRETFTE